MSYSVSLIRQLETVEPSLRQVLLAILEEIEQHRAVTVTRDDFADLHAVVASLTEAQQRTEDELAKLAAAQVELAAAQAETQREMAAMNRSLAATRGQVGGLIRSSAYALENEAYRQLPRLLQERGIRVKDRILYILGLIAGNLADAAPVS